VTYSLGKRSNAELARVHPNLAQVVRRAITLTTQDFCVLDGARSAEEQNALYQIGRKMPGKVVTQKDGYKNKSNHQITADGTGHGVDLVPWVDGKPVWDDTWALHYQVAVAMSQAARDLGVRIKWGGNWYEAMDRYPATIEAMKAAVERYKRDHLGPDHIDAPHFELVA